MNNLIQFISIAGVLFCAGILFMFMDKFSVGWAFSFAGIAVMSMGIARYAHQRKPASLDKS